MRLLAALLLAVPLAAQHGRYLSESKNPAIGNPESIAAGAKLYATSCAGCHGPDGSGGRGPNLVSRALWHPLSDEAIFNAIRNGVPGADMPPTKLPDEQTWNLVAFVHALTGPASENKVPGDVDAGERLFWDAKAGCASCHSIHGRGARMGPDLSNIGARPLAAIREAILQPSKDLSFLGNEAVTAFMKNSDAIQGIARNRSNYSLQIIDAKGALHMLSMTDVKELTVSGRSLMPDDYAKRLSREELRDLLAYLARQTTRTPGSLDVKENAR
jgi:cytochrome c oxidase cbb3-type subunit 3